MVLRRTEDEDDEPKLSPEDRAALLAKDESGKTRFEREHCSHCGGVHLRACPRVRRLEFHPNNAGIAVVEFFDHGQWPDDHIIWPEDVYEGEVDAEAASRD